MREVWRLDIAVDWGRTGVRPAAHRPAAALPDDEPVPHGGDERTELPVRSPDAHAYEPTPEMPAGLEALTAHLNAANVLGYRFRPVRYRPTASKHQGKVCEGCQLHVTAPGAFQPVAVGVAVLSAFRTLYDAFAWREIASEWQARVDAHRRLLHSKALYS